MALVSNPDPHVNSNATAPATGPERSTGHAEPPAERIAAEAAAIFPDTFVTAPSADEVAAEAYAIYMSRGGDHGRDQDDWIEAERKLADRRPRT